MGPVYHARCGAGARRERGVGLASHVWRFPNDLRQARLALLGLGVFDVLIAALVVWLLLVRS
jgi:hypothetical protein